MKQWLSLCSYGSSFPQGQGTAAVSLISQGRIKISVLLASSHYLFGTLLYPMKTPGIPCLMDAKATERNKAEMGVVHSLLHTEASLLDLGEGGVVFHEHSSAK